MSLLVGSVYIDHPRSKAWYDLQLRFLNRTTINFKHVVYLNGSQNFYGNSEILKVDKEPTKGEYCAQQAHIRGLNAIIDRFNADDRYDNLLLLDSDCFPIQPRWQKDLLGSMDGFDVAAVARYENLDTFAHPSAFFVKRPAAATLRFGVFPQTNLVGHEFSDTSSNVTKFFPMIRTNRLNHHPVLCGVYWDRFYHHGAGSRNPLFRLFYSYFNETNNVSSLESKLFDELVANPDRFIEKLAVPTMTRKIY